MKRFNRLFLSFLLFVCLICSPPGDVSAATSKSAGRVSVKVQVSYNYKKAFEILKLINKERAKEGFSTLTMDTSLIKSAMERAVETSVYWDHIRPNGKDCFTISDIVDGENIGVGAYSAEYMMKLWMDSPSHRSNVLDPDWVAVGVGCVDVSGSYYWVQCFSSVKTTATSLKKHKNNSVTKTISVKNNKKFFRPKYSITSRTIKVGKTAYIDTCLDNTASYINIKGKHLKYSSSNTKVCTVSNGKIKAIKKGSAKISVWFPGYKQGAKTFKVKVIK